MRSGFFTKPSPLVEFDCGSQSTSRVLTSAAASEAARLMAVVVLPTPPFWLATAMIRPMILFLLLLRAGYANGFAKSMPDSGATAMSVSRGTLRASVSLGIALRSSQYRQVFHVKHIRRL